MADNLKLQIFSDKDSLFEGSASLVLLPTVGGQIGVMPGYAPYFTKTVSGEIVVKNGSDKKSIPISGGYCSIFNDVIIVFDAANDYRIDYSEKELEAILND